MSHSDHSNDLSGTSYHVGFTWLNAFIFSVALIVGQIPEALNPTVVAVLTLAAKRMTAKNCLVKRMETVENLGSTSLIITEKTGIITSNRMIVSHIWANESIIDSENLYRHLDGSQPTSGTSSYAQSNVHTNPLLSQKVVLRYRMY